jgi:hypothetical protein
LQLLLSQAAAGVVMKAETATAPPSTAKASATATITFFMCVLPFVKTRPLYSHAIWGASMQFAIKETPPRYCNVLPLCT